MAKSRLPSHAWLPLLVFPTLTLPLRGWMSPWVFMWVLAVSIFAGCKWLVYSEGMALGLKAPLGRRLGFLFAWPGMDARTFLGGSNSRRPKCRDWAFASVKTLLGIFLYWAAGRLAGGDLLAGWCGMIGLIFMLHFGSFHLLALAWSTVGVNAQTLMKNPAKAVSVGEFWGRRWNAAFNDIAQRFVFRPLVHRRGVAIATIGAFGFSGILHDLVISVPAQSGYGLPTCYFLLQALGILIERSKQGRAAGLRHRWPGRAFTFALTVIPAFWLFHPPFVRRIVLPMMEATGAL